MTFVRCCLGFALLSNLVCPRLVPDRKERLREREAKLHVLVCGCKLAVARERRKARGEWIFKMDLRSGGGTAVRSLAHT